MTWTSWKPVKACILVKAHIDEAVMHVAAIRSHGALSLMPLSVIWIVAITNAVNLIDGLDGLANGVSAISAATDRK